MGWEAVCLVGMGLGAWVAVGRLIVEMVGLSLAVGRATVRPREEV